LLGRQSRFHILCRLQGDMFLNFLFQSLVVAPPCHHVSKSFVEPPQVPHDKSSAFNSKNRPMIPAVCSQSRSSACNCLRPSRVKRYKRARRLFSEAPYSEPIE